jgi:hypothetical protein
MKKALPERYVVDRIGTPDPTESQYYVVDIVTDTDARVALQRLARDYRTTGQHVRADELAKALDDTADAHVQVLRRRVDWKSPNKKTRQRARS